MMPINPKVHPTKNLHFEFLKCFHSICNHYLNEYLHVNHKINHDFTSI